ncbi:lytic transglycosylase domain-containing protein [Paraburkholderia sp. LEh10]|uniref:lytic transglycosylase domain-containing protein n=1 Tax=Paraburkholderia sp. LEh10 TaxID=2821353 RepID=UPI001AE4B9A6|nr:lytic transglycosylase domain-containing protein [Paraburkholderia sp. LEh10]MBP0594870.1 lytic transglycosylase domain-containing protein [Paraburkholderia sp. LEh10]
MRRVVVSAMLACAAGGCVSATRAAARVETVIGGLKNAEDAGDSEPLVIDFATPFDAKGARSSVLAWTPLVEEAARRFGVDRALLLAVIDVESGGNPFAMSPKGARGLMQLMPATGLLQGADDLFDPYQNVRAGARLLDTLLAKYGEVSLALAAYNAGDGAVRKNGGAIPLYGETQNYVRRVMERVARYRR